MAPDLVTVGGLTVDNVIGPDGQVGLAQAGGNGAYSAVGALMWTSRVGLISTAVASYPRSTIERLRLGGVDLGGVAWSDAQLAACNWFIYDGQGRREEGLTSPPEALAQAGFPTDRLDATQIAEWREMLLARKMTGEVSYSAFRTLTPLTPSQIPEPWRKSRAVLLAPSQPDVMLAMLDHFEPGGSIVIADPGWQLAEHKVDELAPLLSRLDAFLPSEVELRALVPDAGPADALAVLARYCPGALVVKLGAAGSLVWDRQTRSAVKVPAVKAVPRDPTGAGDSFCGGFLAGLMETGDAVQAARFGAISAAQVVACFGADGALPANRAACRALLEGKVSSCA